MSSKVQGVAYHRSIAKQGIQNLRYGWFMNVQRCWTNELQGLVRIEEALNGVCEHEAIATHSRVSFQAEVSFFCLYEVFRSHLLIRNQLFECGQDPF